MNTSPATSAAPPRDPSRVESNRWLMMLREGEYDTRFGEAAARLKRAVDIAERVPDAEERAHLLSTLGWAVISESVKRSACAERDQLKGDMEAARPEVLEMRRYEAAMRHTARELEGKIDRVLKLVAPLRDGSHMDHLHWLAHEMFVFTNYVHAGFAQLLPARAPRPQLEEPAQDAQAEPGSS